VRGALCTSAEPAPPSSPNVRRSLRPICHRPPPFIQRTSLCHPPLCLSVSLSPSSSLTARRARPHVDPVCPERECSSSFLSPRWTRAHCSLLPPYDDTATLNPHALNYNTQCPTEPSAVNHESSSPSRRSHCRTTYQFPSGI
jgi:hypothetical protein